MDEANRRVGAHRRVGVFKPSGIERPAFLIGQICQIRRIFLEFPRHLAHFQRLRLVGCPLREMAVTQIILIVQKQLLQAGTGDIEQAQFSLRRGGGGAAAFSDVLPARAGGLNHLIYRAGTGIEEFPAKPIGGVVNDGGRLEAAGSPVTTAGTKFTHTRLLCDWR